MSEIQFGITDDLTVSNNYIQGGQIVYGLILTEVKYVTVKTIEKACFLFKDAQGALFSLDVLVPSKSWFTAEKQGRTPQDQFEFAIKIFNGKLKHIFNVFKLDASQMPKTKSLQELVDAFAKQLQPLIESGDRKFILKISKSKEGFASIGKDIPFIEEDFGKATTLTFTPEELKMNAIQKTQRGNSTTQAPDVDNISQEDPDIENLQLDIEAEGEMPF